MSSLHMYSETVGKEGHVKRTVNAFNEYSVQMSHADVTRKPPSPSPRRRGPSSPPSARRTQPAAAPRYALLPAALLQPGEPSLPPLPGIHCCQQPSFSQANPACRRSKVCIAASSPPAARPTQSAATPRYALLAFLFVRGLKGMCHEIEIVLNSF
jgi:hypothetical protein